MSASVTATLGPRTDLPAARVPGVDRRQPARYRLLRPGSHPAPISPSTEQRRVIEHARGRLRVLAGPGTGKTATIVEAVADRVVGRGLDPSSILVLTFSRRAAAELSAKIAARLDIIVTEPLVRTLHSYAYAVVRAAALGAGDAPPRLQDASRADLMVREMLAGHAEDGGAYWPTHLRVALRVPAFAAELREFMLRTAERRLTPGRIALLARRAGRPEWQAAAAFVAEYRDIADLRQGAGRSGAALDQAELTTAALDRMGQPEALAAQQRRIRRIFVDEYQDLDPAQARLVDLLASGADELVVVGDPDQSIYGFRGAAAGALQRVAVDDTVALTVSHRMRPALLEATRRVAGQLPGPALHRALRSAAEPGGNGPLATGSVDVRVLPSPAAEASYVADRLRRAHLEGGIAWSQMAVLLRAPAQSADPLRRACSTAGVPLTAAAAGPLAAEPLVASLLTVLRAGIDPASLTAPAALALLSSPLGGMDPLAVRRLRRAVRAAGPSDGAGGRTHGDVGRTQLGEGGPGAPPHAGADRPRSSADMVAAILRRRCEPPAGLPPDLDVPLRRLIDLVALANGAAGSPAAEDVLWRVWGRSGLADRLLTRSERGGRDAAHADRLLDSAVALFDRAAELADQRPGADVRALLELVDGERITGPVGDHGTADAVSLLSAHAAKGLEWDVVAVVGVQQETWPDLRPRASLLDLAALLDAAAGIGAGTPAAGRLADERRLFYVAVTRARRLLVATAVQDDEHEPSRFLAELAGTETVPTGWPRDRQGSVRRALNLPALVADLRRAVTAPGADDDVAHRVEAAHAAVALARLAAAGVPGAHPDTWHGLAEISTDAPLVAPGADVVLSPSQVESLLDCPLRTVLERHGARGDPGQPQLLGVAVHALAQGIAAGATDADLDAAAEEFLAGQEHLPPWEVARLRRLLHTMTQALINWVHTAGAEREFVGSEVGLDVRVPAGDGCAGEPAPAGEDAGETGGGVRLVGRVDWLSVDGAGRLVVTDFKSGASVPSRAAVQQNAQLAVYQVAAALGGFQTAHGGDDTSAAPTGVGAPELGGAELVHLRAGRPRTVVQPPQDGQERARWIGRLREAAAAVSGSAAIARQGDGCERCPVRSSCPLQPEGRQVTR